MRQGLNQLVLLQQVDVALEQQKQRLNSAIMKEEMDECKKQLVYWSKKLSAYQGKLKMKQERLKQLESQFSLLAQTISRENQEIYQENAYSGKKLLSMLEVVKREEEQLNKLENDIFSCMTEQEEVQTQCNLIKDKYQQVKQLHDKKQLEIEKVAQEVEGSTEQLMANRQELYAEINNKLLREYEKKKKGYKGKLVVEVLNDRICQGCHVKINMHDWKRILNGQTVRCEKCGRYLINNM